MIRVTCDEQRLVHVYAPYALYCQCTLGIMSAFIEVSLPGSAVHGKIMPGGKVKPEGFQILLPILPILLALLWATPAPFATSQLAKEDLLGNAVVFHAKNMSKPAEVVRTYCCLHGGRLCPMKHRLGTLCHQRIFRIWCSEC